MSPTSRFTCDYRREISGRSRTSRSPICASASSSTRSASGARWAFRKHAAGMERALTGKAAGSPNGKRIFRDPPHLGWPEALPEGATAPSCGSAAPGSPAKSATGRPLSAAARRTPFGAVGVAGRYPSPAGGTCDPGGICLSGGRSGHARDEMTEVLLSDRTGARRTMEVVPSCFEW